MGGLSRRLVHADAIARRDFFRNAQWSRRHGKVAADRDTDHDCRRGRVRSGQLRRRMTKCRGKSRCQYHHDFEAEGVTPLFLGDENRTLPL
jgi:hypothetical protein